MNAYRFILRNLLFFRAASLAVLAGVAVASAVLTGALMVGDSVRGSLRELAVQRLGPTDYALAAPRFFEQSLAGRVAGATDLRGRFDVVSAVIVTGGAAAGQGDARRRTGDVQIAAVGGASWAPVDAGAAILNGETADALGLATRDAGGDGAVVFTFPSMDDAPREAAVARRDVADAVAQLPVRRSSVVAGRGMLSLFALNGGQRVPRNAWVNLPELQQAVGQSGRANVLLVHEKAPATERTDTPHVTAAGVRSASELNVVLKGVLALGDYGLAVRPAGASGEAALTSTATYLPPAVLDAASRVAREMNVAPRLVTVNLVNRIVRTPAGGGGDAPTTTTLHYSIAAGISSVGDGAGGDKPLAPGEVVLNEATAKQLNATVGDAVTLFYSKREAGGELREASSADAGLTFRVARVLPMPAKPGQSLAADPSLTPQYKGLTDAASVSAWDPPKELGIDEKLAEKDQDAYWRQYKASPRLFVSIDAARRMWGGPYGDVTSVRVPAGRAEEFATRLREAIDPAAMGFAFRPVKAEQVAAATGGTDFSELFLYFSFFLIVAAALLVAMLFRLAVEQRARQFGLLTAVGFAPGRLRGLALAEGMILAVVGSIVGVAVGIGYTALLVHGLRTWWVGAIGTTALRLFVSPTTLAYGFAASLFVAFGAIVWGVWRVGRVAPARLLAGGWGGDAPGKARAGRMPRIAGVALALVGLAILGATLGRVLTEYWALGAGALLLTGALAWLGGVLRPRRHARVTGMSSVEALGVRNATRHTGRSILSVGLIAFAAFTLILVAAMQRRTPDDTGDRRSGAGGYRLIVQAGVPLLGDPNTRGGRELLGVRDADNPLWAAATFTPMRRWAGQDVSCLNLTRPSSPTILGVPHAMVERGGFEFAATTQKADNPWTLVESPPEGPGGDVVPIIADAETAEFILKLSIGKTMPIADQLGRPRQLKLVATLHGSIFQSELLMSDANFRLLFPAQAGFGTVLADVPAGQVQPLRQLLNNEWEPYAVSVDTTAARLETYKAIVNTYLSTFQTLGALGLALGTIGLAVVLVRNVIERRPELALLSALGFRPNDRVRLVLSENAFLLVLGLLVGAACALLGVVPTVLNSRGGIAWRPLGLTLAAVLVVGLVASALAVWASGVRTTPADLRNE